MLICGLVIILWLVAYYIPYPFTIEADGIMENENTAELLIPYSKRSYICDSLNAYVILEGWPNTTINFIIRNVDKGVIYKQDGNYFNAHIIVNDKPIPVPIHMGLKVHATIIVSNNTFWEYIFTPMGRRIGTGS